MFENFKKLIGNGKTLALGTAAVFIKIMAPIAQSHGWEIPTGFEDAVATILLFLMGFIGLGSKSVRVDEKADAAHTNVINLENQVAILQNAENERKRLTEEIKKREEEAKRKAAEEAKLKTEAEAKAAEDAKKRAEIEEKEKLQKEVEELKRQLQEIK